MFASISWQPWASVQQSISRPQQRTCIKLLTILLYCLQDNLLPISCKGANWQGGVGLTLIDSLDMLLLLNRRADIQQALHQLEGTVSFEKDAKVCKLVAYCSCSLTGSTATCNTTCTLLAAVALDRRGPAGNAFCEVSPHDLSAARITTSCLQQHTY